MSSGGRNSHRRENLLYDFKGGLRPPSLPPFRYAPGWPGYYAQCPVPDDERDRPRVPPTRLRALIATALREQPNIAGTRDAGSVMVDRLDLDVVDAHGSLWRVIVMNDARGTGEPQ